MNPHYSMAIINLCIASGVGLGLLVWKLVLKKKITLFYLLLLISVLPLLSMLRPGPYESGDLSLHAMRAMPFYESLTQFHQLPKWAADLHLGYGDAYFEFLYITPYIVISLFHAIGLSFIDSVKLVFATTYIASGVMMYVWMKEEHGEKAAFVAALFYLFAPYHLVDMHFRATIAESSSFLFLPLLLWLASRYFKTYNMKFAVATSMSYALFLLTHPVMFVSFTPFLAVYAVLQWVKDKSRNAKPLVVFICSLFVSLILTTFYWLPIQLESRYILQSLDTRISFYPWWMYFVSPWRWGLLFQGPMGELSYIIGYTQLAVVGLAVFLLYRRKIPTKEKQLVLFCLVSALVCFTMMQSFTAPLWDRLPLIKNFQFVYRLLAPIAFFIAALAGIVVMKIKRQVVIVGLCVVTMGYTLLNWGNRGTVPSLTDEGLKNILLHGPITITGFEPTSPIWVNREDTRLLERPANPVEVVEGNATVTPVNRNAIHHEYVVDAAEQSLVRDNTFYFPGWNVYVDGVQTDVYYDTDTYSGVIHFTVPEGKHHVVVAFEDTAVRAQANKVSLAALGICTIALCIYKGRR